MLESLFDEVASLQACNFIKKRLQHRFFLVKFAKLLRTPILKSVCKRRLLELDLYNCWSQEISLIVCDEISTGLFFPPVNICLLISYLEYHCIACFNCLKMSWIFRPKYREIKNQWSCRKKSIYICKFSYIY